MQTSHAMYAHPGFSWYLAPCLQQPTTQVRDRRMRRSEQRTAPPPADGSRPRRRRRGRSTSSSSIRTHARRVGLKRAASDLTDPCGSLGRCSQREKAGNTPMDNVDSDRAASPLDPMQLLGTAIVNHDECTNASQLATVPVRLLGTAAHTLTVPVQLLGTGHVPQPPTELVVEDCSHACEFKLPGCRGTCQKPQGHITNFHQCVSCWENGERPSLQVTSSLGSDDITEIDRGPFLLGSDRRRRRLSTKTFVVTEPASHFQAEFQASKERCTDSHPPDPEWAWSDVDGWAWSDIDGAIDVCRKIDEFLKFDASEGGHAARHWPELISTAFPTLAGKMLDDQLLALVFETKQRRRLTRGGLQVIEYFAGAGMIAYFAILNGLRVAQFDKCYSNAHDSQTALGLRNWMGALMDTAADAWAWMASQCSSWVILCRYNSKRSDANQYLGDIDKPFVQAGNSLMAITSLLFFSRAPH
jgi:hypothetical protein